jgi:hypothetical protein
MEPNPYQSPQGPPEPRPKARWRWRDRIAMLYLAWLVIAGVFAITKLVLAAYFGIPLEPMFPRLPNF